TGGRRQGGRRILRQPRGRLYVLEPVSARVSTADHGSGEAPSGRVAHPKDRKSRDLGPAERNPRRSLGCLGREVLRRAERKEGELGRPISGWPLSEHQGHLSVLQSLRGPVGHGRLHPPPAVNSSSWGRKRPQTPFAGAKFASLNRRWRV